MRINAACVLLATGLVLVACGGGSSTTTPYVATADFYVDANTGSDANNGAAATPFKTVTHALATAAQGTLIQVNPGIYDLANGETFPLQMKTGQRLRGDEANRGVGTTATRILGEASVDVNQYRTLLLAADCKVSGILFAGTGNVIGHHPVRAAGVMCEVFLNTFGPTVYGGVRIDGPDSGQGMAIVRHNTFNSQSYGCYLRWDPAPIDVYANQFNTPYIAIDISAGAASTIRSNEFLSEGGGCIQATGPHGIRGNTFNSPTAHLYGAIRCAFTDTAMPTVRGNTFLCPKAIQIDFGTPDLGSAADPGGNNFAGVTGACVEHNGTATVQAVGNTWPTSPPANGTEIVITAAGTVIWGSGAGQQYP